VSNIWTISCDNSETERDRMPISINRNRKSHTGFRLIPTWMTLNDIERRNNPYFAFFSPNSIALLANYVTLVEDRPIMSSKYCLPVSVFHFWPKLTHPAARSLCDSWATCHFYKEISYVQVKGNSLKYMLDKNYQNTGRLDKATATMKRCNVLTFFVCIPSLISQLLLVSCFV